MEALEATRAGRAAWLALSSVERSACLRRVLDHLRTSTEWASHLGCLLGVQRAEVESEFRSLEEWSTGAGQWTDPESGSLRATEPGADLAVVFAEWTDLVSGLFRRIARQLEGDRGVVVVSDKRWPAGADALSAAISAAGLPTGVVSVLHGLPAPLRDTLIGMAAGESSSEPEHHARVRATATPIALDLGIPELGNRSFVVKLEHEAGEGLREAAQMVVDQAFGRAKTLSGQRPGRLARVICHARVFSKFCEHLVAALEASSDVREPLPQIDNEAINSIRALWNLGLDEGATLIFGGESFEAAPGSRARDPRVWPAVYCNVDPEMALSRIRETAPVLCLIRAESDEAAEQLARDLD